MVPTRTGTQQRRSTHSAIGCRFVALLAAAVLLQSHGTEGFRSASPLAAVKRHRTERAPLSPTPTPPIAFDTAYASSATTPSSTTSVPSSTTTSSTTALSLTATDLLSNSDVWVFAAGIFPFAWATYEFWRRIMFGESFGTGSDRVIIGFEDAPQDSRGTRVLGKGAIAVAYFLFVSAFVTLAVVGYSVATSEAPSEEALAAVSAAASASAASAASDAAL